jgi:hypothetical protein
LEHTEHKLPQDQYKLPEKFAHCCCYRRRYRRRPPLRHRHYIFGSRQQMNEFQHVCLM